MTNKFTFTHISIDQTDVSRKMLCCVGVGVPDDEALCCVDRSVAGEAAWLWTLDSRVHGYWLPLASPTPPVIRTHVSYTAVIHKRGRTALCLKPIVYRTTAIIFFAHFNIFIHSNLFMYYNS